MALSPDIVESVANANLKNLGDAPAFHTAISMGNAVAHQQAMQQIQLAATGSIVKRLTELDPSEAVAVLKATSGNEVASQLTALLAALNSGQQGVKAAGNTPPVTP